VQDSSRVARASPPVQNAPSADESAPQDTLGRLLKVKQRNTKG